MIVNADTLSLSADTAARVVHPIPSAVHVVAPADTVQYLGVLPNVFPEPKEMVSDTLPHFNVIPFVTKDTVKLTRYHSMREFAPGMEGTPLVKDPCRGDLMTTIILAFSLMTLFILSHTQKYFYQRIHDFFMVHSPARKFIIDTVGDARSIGLLIMQTIVFSAILFFCYFVHADSALANHVPLPVLFLLYTSLLFIYFCLKWAIYSFLGWIFLDKKQTTIILKSYSTIVCLMGFVVFPFVLWTVFFYITPTYLTIIGLCLIILAKILILYKWIKLFSQKFFHHILLILYFCALEVIPCFLVCESMVQMNNMLIKNF